MKKWLLFTLVTMVACISVAQPEVPAAKRQEIEKMLRLTGMEKLMGQMKTQLIASLKAQMPQQAEPFWTKFEPKLDTRELIEQMIPLYDKYYTLEDLKAVNAFYESDPGQKILSTLPKVMQEGMKIAQEWGEKVGRQAELEARQEQSSPDKD